MIAPLHPPRRADKSLAERRGMRKARRWIVRSLLEGSEAKTSSVVSKPAVWAATLWLIVVACAYFGYLLRGLVGQG